MDMQLVLARDMHVITVDAENKVGTNNTKERH
jgi:hypothetical protein